MVLVVHPLRMLRQALGALVGTLGVGSAVLEASTDQEAAELLKRSGPAIVLLAGHNADDPPTGACRLIQASAPGARLLVLMSAYSLETGLDVLRAGAHGCLVHDADRDELQQALAVLAAGGTYVSPAVGDALALSARRYAAGGAWPESPRRPISTREEQVLLLIAEGQANSAIARTLSLSVKTVESHKARLAAKLGVRGSVGLITYAIRRGLVDVGAPRTEAAAPSNS
jgi:DNA-binding NarL/FixJ family response regulator